MKNLSIIICAVVIFFIGLTTVEVQAQSKPIVQSLTSTAKSPKRLVLIFAATAADARWQKQQELLQQAHQEMTARDLMVLGVLGNQVRSSTYKISRLPNPDDLREQYQVKPGEFTVILVGKDGTEKYRAPDVIKPGTIFHIIDAMPMRQQEMRRQNQ